MVEKKGGRRGSRWWEERVAVMQQRSDEGGEEHDFGRVRVAWLRHDGAMRREDDQFWEGEGGVIAAWQRKSGGWGTTIMCVGK